jgi:hypothetical protein
MKPRFMRAVDFTAECLEEMADSMPLGYKDEADIWRGHAKFLLSSENPKMVRVWEDPI